MAKRLNMSSTIVMSSSQFAVTSVNNDTGEEATIDLHGTTRDQRSQIGRALCELHGIRHHKRKAHKKPSAEKGEVIGMSGYLSKEHRAADLARMGD